MCRKDFLECRFINLSFKEPHCEMEGSLLPLIHLSIYVYLFTYLFIYVYYLNLEKIEVVN